MNRIHTQESSIIPFSFISQLSRKIRIFPLGCWLLLAFPLWLSTEAIAPQMVQAYTARVNLALQRLPEENYETIVRRAEVVARAAAQRSFDKDILVTEVSIIVTAKNQGMVVPVLALDVSRLQWKQIPDPQRWVTYFKMARSLLLFTKPTTETNPTTTATNQATPTTRPMPTRINNPGRQVR